MDDNHTPDIAYITLIGNHSGPPIQKLCVDLNHLSTEAERSAGDAFIMTELMNIVADSTTCYHRDEQCWFEHFPSACGGISREIFTPLYPNPHSATKEADIRISFDQAIAVAESASAFDALSDDAKMHERRNIVDAHRKDSDRRHRALRRLPATSCRDFVVHLKDDVTFEPEFVPKVESILHNTARLVLQAPSKTQAGSTSRASAASRLIRVEARYRAETGLARWKEVDMVSQNPTLQCAMTLTVQLKGLQAKTMYTVEVRAVYNNPLIQEMCSEWAPRSIKTKEAPPLPALPTPPKRRQPLSLEEEDDDELEEDEESEPRSAPAKRYCRVPDHLPHRSGDVLLGAGAGASRALLPPTLAPPAPPLAPPPAPPQQQGVGAGAEQRYKCLLTLHQFSELVTPVLAADGHVYEKAAMVQYFDRCQAEDHPKSPSGSGEPMPSKQLIVLSAQNLNAYKWLQTEVMSDTNLALRYSWKLKLAGYLSPDELRSSLNNDNERHLLAKELVNLHNNPPINENTANLHLIRMAKALPKLL